MTKPHLFAAGGAHIDRRGRVHGRHVAEASNPGSMREEVGGGAMNAARVAVQRGVSVSLLSLRGGDAAGQKVAEAVEEAGIADLSATFLDRTTPSYTAILTEEGDLITGLADMKLYELAFAKQLRRRAIREAVASADAVLCDANMPSDALELLASLAGNQPLYAIAISPAKIHRLTPILGRLSCLFMNRREALALAGTNADTPLREAALTLQKKGLRAAVITAGGSPAIVLHNDDVFEVTPPPISHIADVTGAGDALAGATISALMQGHSLGNAVRQGLAAAKLAVESERAVPDVDGPAFHDALASVPTEREGV